MTDLTPEERAKVAAFSLDRSPRHLLMPTLAELLSGIGEADIEEDE